MTSRNDEALPALEKWLGTWADSIPAQAYHELCAIQRKLTPRPEPAGRVEGLPLQPFVTDERGVLRFRANKLVRHLLDHGGIDMNDLAMVDCPNEDREQFAQLIGYSIDGFNTLSYVTDETWDRVTAAHAPQEGAE